MGAAVVVADTASTMIRARASAQAAAAALALLTPLSFGVGAAVGGTAQTWLANASFTAAAAFAVVALALGCSRISDRERRRPWRFLLVAMGCWLAGQLLWDAYFVVGTVPPSPSAADAAWLGCGVLAIVALVRAAPGSGVSRWIGFLDTLALAAAGGGIGVATFWDDAQRSSLSSAGVAVALGYSVLYCGVAASLVPALFRRTVVHRHPELVLVAAGVLLQAAGFVLWTPRYLDGTYQVGTELTDPPWLLGLLALGAAGLLAPRGGTIPEPSQRALRWRGLLPALAGIGLIAISIAATVTGRPEGEELAVEGALAALLALLAARTWLLHRDQARAAERERTLSRQNRLLLEAAGEGIVAGDVTGRISVVNAAAAAMFGWPAEELPGRDVHDTVHHSRPDGTPCPREECSLRAAREGDPVQFADEVFWRRDGSPFAVEGTSTPIVEGGEVVGFVTVFRDITERKALEEQLRQSQKMEAVGQLAGGVAHDFNNLLTAIGGYTDLALERAGGDAALRSDLLEVRRGADRAASLVQQLLAFSRRQVLQPSVVDPNESIRELEAMLGRVLGEQIEIVTRLDPGVGSVTVDPVQLHQVLVNLALNARDAMPDGGTLTLSSASVERGAYVAIGVADTGSGMDAETRAAVFEPFFTTKEPGKGTGLGLSTVYGIVAQSGGRIEVRSEPGAGSEFTILLPRTDEHAPAAGLAGERRRGAGSETILLVEDDEAVRGLLLSLLERSGYSVIAAGRPDEAVTAAAALRETGGALSLLVTDVVMPHQSGPDLARSLVEAEPGLKVLYISGYAESRLDEIELGGGTRFLAKPFSLGDFSHTVRELLDAPV